MSDTNRVTLAYAIESAFGAPTSLAATAFQALRFTGEDLAATTQSVNSSEIRDDRQIAFVARTGFNAGGNLNFELSYGAFDDLLMLFAQASAWTAAITVTSTSISAAAADNSFNHSGAGFTAAAGRWLKVTGFATAANNGYFKVVTATTSKLIVSGGTLVNEAATPSVTIIAGAQIVNGTTLNSLAIQRVYNDLSAIIALYRGMCIDSMSLTIPADNIVTGSFGTMGKSEASGGAIVGSGTAAAPTNDPMTGVDNVPVVYEAMSSYSITQASLQGKNNLRNRIQVGTLGPISIGSGTVELTGNVTAYFNTSAVMDKYLAFTSSSVALRFQDTAGNVMVFDMPKIKYTSGKRVAGGINQDVLAEMGFTAFRDPTEGITFRIVRFPA